MKWDNYSLLWSRRSCYWFLIESLSLSFSLCVSYRLVFFPPHNNNNNNKPFRRQHTKMKMNPFFHLFFYLSKRASRKDEGGCVCFILDSFSTVSAVYIHIHMHRRKKIKTNLQRIPRQSPDGQQRNEMLKKNVKLLFEKYIPAWLLPSSIRNSWNSERDDVIIYLNNGVTFSSTVFSTSAGYRLVLLPPFFLFILLFLIPPIWFAATKSKKTEKKKKANG